MDSDVLLKLVEMIYSAAGDPSGWEPLIEHLAGVLDATTGTLHNQDSSSQTEQALLLALMPHLQLALQLHNRILGLETKSNNAEEVLDALREGVILLDEHGTVILVNQTASRLLGREKTLRLCSAGLSACRRDEETKLRELIRGALKTSNGAVHPGGAMTIARDGFQRPLQLLVAPLRPQTIHLGRAVPVVAIFIADPDAKPQLPAQWLAQLYELTPAEARLAVLLAGGDTLKEASKQLGVSLSTVQSQLKSIFGKTGTSRQSELVLLLATAPARGPVR